MENEIYTEMEEEMSLSIVENSIVKE